MEGYNPFSLINKKLLVTGASSGIGRAVAIECSRMGAEIYIVGRNESRLTETLEKMDGDNHVSVQMDITNAEDLESLVSKVPVLSGIVHCAGITKIEPFGFVNRTHLDEVFNTNFYAPVELTRLLLKKKKISKKGSVVFISSISGLYCSAVASSIYSASKSALNGIMKGMAIDLSPKDVRVNCVNPAVIDTGFFKNSGISEEDLEKDKKRYPLRRYGKPEEVAYATIYLLSDASEWVTGTNMLIDGGYTLL